jgi:hypothetical protein
MMREVGAFESIARLSNDAHMWENLREAGDDELIGFTDPDEVDRLTRKEMVKQRGNGADIADIVSRKVVKKNKRYAMEVKNHILQVDTVEKRDRLEERHTKRFMNKHCVLLVAESAKKRKEGAGLVLDLKEDIEKLKTAASKVEKDIFELPGLLEDNPFDAKEMSELPGLLSRKRRAVLLLFQEREREQTAKLPRACKKKKEEGKEEKPPRKRPKQNKGKKKKKKQRVGNMVLNNAGDGNFTVSASFDGEFVKIDDNIYTTKEKATTAYDDWKASKEEEGN